MKPSCPDFQETCALSSAVIQDLARTRPADLRCKKWPTRFAWAHLCLADALTATADSGRTSHELSPTEGRNVGNRKVKPFAILPPVTEAGMPIGFDAERIIGLDGMDDLGFLWELNRELTLSASRRVRSTNLVEPSGLQKVDETELYLRSCFSFVKRCTGRFDAERGDIVQTASNTELAESGDELVSASQSAQSGVAWEFRIGAAFQLDLGVHREMPNLASEFRQSTKHVIGRSGNIRIVRLETRFLHGIAPPCPVLAKPVGLLDPGLSAESLTAEGNTTVRAGSTTNLGKDMGL